MLSIAIAVYNEEKNIGKCLESVNNWAGEIIVVDGGSSDKTIDIAKQFTDKIIITDNPPIFHLNKQKALDACKGDWILQLDADEIVNQLLKNEIDKVVNETGINGYYLPRKNYFLGHWLQKGGQYPDWVIRLFRNGKGKFPCKNVHEQIVIEGEIGYLQSPLMHYPYRTLSEYWTKAKRYSLLVTANLKNQHHNLLIEITNYLFLKPSITFFSIFLRHLGFYDGIFGFLFAFLSAIQSPLALIYFLKHKIYGSSIKH